MMCSALYTHLVGLILLISLVFKYFTLWMVSSCYLKVLLTAHSAYYPYGPSPSLILQLTTSCDSISHSGPRHLQVHVSVSLFLVWLLLLPLFPALLPHTGSTWFQILGINIMYIESNNIISILPYQTLSSVFTILLYVSKYHFKDKDNVNHIPTKGNNLNQVLFILHYSKGTVLKVFRYALRQSAGTSCTQPKLFIINLSQHSSFISHFPIQFTNCFSGFNSSDMRLEPLIFRRLLDNSFTSFQIFPWKGFVKVVLVLL